MVPREQEFAAIPKALKRIRVQTDDSLVSTDQFAGDINLGRIDGTAEHKR